MAGRPSKKSCPWPVRGLLGVVPMRAPLGKGGVRLDPERRIGRQPGARARVGPAISYVGVTDDRVADQPVELDRLIGSD